MYQYLIISNKQVLGNYTSLQSAKTHLQDFIQGDFKNTPLGIINYSVNYSDTAGIDFHRDEIGFKENIEKCTDILNSQ